MSVTYASSPRYGRYMGKVRRPVAPRTPFTAHSSASEEEKVIRRVLPVGDNRGRTCAGPGGRRGGGWRRGPNLAAPDVPL